MNQESVVSQTRNLIKSIGLLAALIVPLAISPSASAATSPTLGAANSFVILSDTYSNTTPGTVLNGDLGYTTPPATAPTVNGATHQADSVYNQAGIDQNNALIALDNQPCDFTFAPGPIDLATDTTHGPVGVYTPGVYCISGAGSIGGGGTITLNGSGTYIFRMDGALTTSANSQVVLAGSASACDVWWTPTQASTLGADTTFVGTNIAAAGITVGNETTWTGQALAFGGTVTTDNDIITAPVCPDSRSLTPPAPTSPSSPTDDPTSPFVPGLPDTADGATSNAVSVWIAGLAVIVAAIATAYLSRIKS